MNDRYFACTNCRIYTDAGYRWAYWTLEDTNVVALDATVDVARVLNASEYWEPEGEAESRWLLDSILPTVRRFLVEHGDHSISYFDYDHFARKDETALAGWRELTD